MKRILLFLLSAVLLGAGCCLITQPLWQAQQQQQRTEKAIASFDAKMQAADPAPERPYASLYGEMAAYNTRIYEENQQSLCDAWSYETNVFDFSAAGLPDDMLGYLTIPAMDCELPLYIGANTENMAKGAVVLSQTSMPLGGVNTNCVIAAHRGYYGVPMFREIEVLQPGDAVTITTVWETLHYEVAKCIVIEPDDIDAVKILDGQDLVTLVTCHPYTDNTQRYVVYCTRTDVAEESPAPPEIPFDGVPFTSSEPAIRQEQQLTRFGVAGIVAAALALLLFLLLRKRKK